MNIWVLSYRFWIYSYALYIEHSGLLADHRSLLYIIYTSIRSSLIYNTSSDTSDTKATRVRHECDTSETRVLHERHECDTSVTRIKKLDFDNDAGTNIFSHPYIYHMASEKLQGKEQFRIKNYLLEISPFHANAFKKYTTKTKLFNGKNYIKKLYTRL